MVMMTVRPTTNLVQESNTHYGIKVGQNRTDANKKYILGRPSKVGRSAMENNIYLLCYVAKSLYITCIFNLLQFLFVIISVFVLVCIVI